MKKLAKRLGASVIALCLCAGTLSAFTTTESASAAEVIFFSECEDLDVEYTWDASASGKPQLWTDIYGQELPGYSGDGFVYLTGDTLVMTVDAPAEGMYEIVINYAQILDKDGRVQTISINGTDYTFTMPYSDYFQELDLGRFRFQEGENTVELKPQYGYGCYDTITISTTDPVDLSVEPTTCDPDATSETKSLMNYLTSVYGEHVISGQQEIYGGGHDDDPDGYEKEFEYLYNLTGEYPAIRAFDFMNYNPLYGWDDGTTERAIEWVTERGGIISASWHINLPKDFNSYEIGEAVDWTQCSYEKNSTFNVANVTVDGSKEKQYFDLAIADLAEQFTRLQDAGVPIIFRPLHEAEGNGGLDGSGSWFWWSQDGVEAYKDLWIYLYDQLTNKYGLHNIIWEQNLYAWSDESAEWYIGDDYVDIVGFDKYDTVYNRHDGLTSGPNEDADSSVFYSLVNYVDGKKMVSMPENSTIPSVKNIQVEEAYWLYFCTWYDNGQDNFISGENYQNTDSVIEMYQSDLCITLSELPDDLYTNVDGFASDDTTTPQVTTTTSAGPTMTETGTTTDVDITTTTTVSETIEPDVTTTTTANVDADTDNQDTNFGIPVDSSEATMCGDINLDGNVTLADVVCASKLTLGIVDGNETQKANGDCSGDGYLYTDDIIILVGFQIGIYPSIPLN